MTNFDGVTMYWGCNGGSMAKTLRHMEESDIMISYATTHDPWDGIDNLFVDSGGYSLMLQTGEHDPVDEYMEYVVEQDAKVAALQDYPCEPEILAEYDRTVRDHQEMSVERAAENLAYMKDNNVDAEPMIVLQGWEPDDYLRCIDRYRDAGVMTEKVGIGSVCRRNAIKQIRDVITTISNKLPNKQLHAFGVKKSILKYKDMREALDSVDSSAWYFGMYQGKPVEEPAWHTTTHMYLEYKRDLYDHFELSEQARDGQETIEAWT